MVLPKWGSTWSLSLFIPRVGLPIWFTLAGGHLDHFLFPNLLTCSYIQLIKSVLVWFWINLLEGCCWTVSGQKGRGTSEAVRFRLWRFGDLKVRLKEGEPPSPSSHYIDGQKPLLASAQVHRNPNLWNPQIKLMSLNMGFWFWGFSS